MHLRKTAAHSLCVMALVVIYLTCFTPFIFGAPPNKATQALLDSFRFDATNGPIVDIDSAKRALQSGANPNYISDNPRRMSVFGELMRMCALDAAYYPELVTRVVETLEILHNFGGRLQYIDADILFFPVAGGYTDVVRWLLEHGASATYWTPGIGTALMPIEYASREGHSDIVALLQEHGATAVRNQDTLQMQLIHAAGEKDIEEMDALLSQGARVNGKDADGKTALLAAVEFFRGFTDYLAIMFLLDKGADPNVKGDGLFDRSTPPLHELVWFVSLVEDDVDLWPFAEQLVYAFLKQGALISATDGGGKTPLHHAAETNGVASARILLESGAKVMPRDHNGKTPLNYAEGADMILLLKEHGATER
jgi:hypothetical protein